MKLQTAELKDLSRERARRKALANNNAFKDRLHLHKMRERQKQIKLRCASIVAGVAWTAVAVQLFK